VEYLPFHTYLGCDIGRWNSFLREELNEMISFYNPRIVVFDGHVPYGGLVGAIDDNRQLASIWCRRGMWASHQGADIINRERHFDAVIEPRDIAESFDRGLTTQYRDRTRPVAPIRLLDPEELLDREAARCALDLRQDDPAVLIMFGSGNNYDYETVRNVVFARLDKVDKVQIVAAEWIITDQPNAPPAHVRRLNSYPISRMLAAFDFAISAAGYNSFHELLFANVPTIFVPNENPQQDDQLARAEFAECHGLGLCVRRQAVYRLGPAIDRLLDSEVRESIRARCAMLDSTNGTLEAVRIVEEMAYARRADRPNATSGASPPASS
jgi:UDP:flavonoid glycosyltransferase YjiC (YdhE family)